MTDGQLLQRYAADRDADAFAELVRRHGGMVHASARRLAPHDAEDVTQAVFLLLAQRAAKLAHYRNLAGWLYGVTRYCAANARRTRGRRQRHLEQYQREQREAVMTDVPAPAEGDRAGNELLDAALARLKDDQRQAVLLRYIEGLSLEESAERLGVNAAAVAKRAERGIARLREYFQARGVSFADAALAATPVSAALVVQVTSGVTGSASAGAAASLAAVTKTSMTLAATAKVAAVVLIAAGAAVATVGVAKRVGQPTSASAAPTRPAPATSAPVAGLTQEAARATAAAFTRALRDRDEPAAANLLIALSPDEARAAAGGFIAHVRDGLYASYPQRLGQTVNSVFQSDGAGGFTNAAIDCPPPTDADMRRLSVRLLPQAGAWRVSDALVINGSVQEQSPRPLPTATAPHDPNVPPGTYARAAEQFARFQSRMTFESDVTKLDAPSRARVAEMLKAAQQDVRELAATLAPTDLSMPPADVERVNAWLERARQTLETQGAAEFMKLGESAKTDKEFARASQKLWGLGQTLDTRAEGEVAATATNGSRPPSFGPPVTLTLAWDNNRVVTIDGPVAVPRWFRESPTFKTWQKRKFIQTFRTTGDDGVVYEIHCSGGTIDQEGNSRDWIPHVSLFRPDGTLAASADYDMNGHATSWGTFDKTGLVYTQKVVTEHAGGGGGPDAPPKLAQVIFFDEQKNQRVWEIGDKNVATHEVLKDPIGTPTRRRGGATTAPARRPLTRPTAAGS